MHRSEAESGNLLSTLSAGFPFELCLYKPDTFRMDFVQSAIGVL